MHNLPVATPQPVQLSDENVLHELSVTLDKYSPQRPIVRSSPIQKVSSSFLSAESMDSSVPDSMNHSSQQRSLLHTFPQVSTLQNQLISVSPAEESTHGMHLVKESQESVEHSDEEESSATSLFHCIDETFQQITNVELVMRDE